MAPVVSISELRKTYDGGFEALKGVSLQIDDGEILALLGPNGAGKTTLISAVCGITIPTSGSITVAGHDVQTDYRAARKLIGLVPQEVALEPFEKVINTVRLSRGLFGKRRDDAVIERVLQQLSLWDKRDAPIQALSGGMKRRVLIAKALSHEPRVLFLDEPTAGVDVELRKEMWKTVRGLQEAGVTIILTTHYIEEAEAMADRVGVIDKGRLLLVEDKSTLMQRMAKKELRIWTEHPLSAIPEALAAYDLQLAEDGHGLTYVYETRAEDNGVSALLANLAAAGVEVRDVRTRQSSLEDIFVDLVKDNAS